jgi:Na+/proline symporter
MSVQTTLSPTTADGALLRFALKADAVITGINALAYLAAFAVLDSWLGVPTAALLGVGAFLAVYAGLVWRLATRASMPAPAVAAVIAGNVLWAVDSLIALGLDWFSPTIAGQVVIAVQAVGVAGFAAIQYVGLRRREG